MIYFVVQPNKSNGDLLVHETYVGSCLSDRTYVPVCDGLGSEEIGIRGQTSKGTKSRLFVFSWMSHGFRVGFLVLQGYV